MNATQEFMDNTDWVERYAWFGAFKDLQGVNEVRQGSNLPYAPVSCL